MSNWHDITNNPMMQREYSDEIADEMELMGIPVREAIFYRIESNKLLDILEDIADEYDARDEIEALFFQV